MINSGTFIPNVSAHRRRAHDTRLEPGCIEAFEQPLCWANSYSSVTRDRSAKRKTEPTPMEPAQ